MPFPLTLMIVDLVKAESKYLVHVSFLIIGRSPRGTTTPRICQDRQAMKARE